MRYIVYFAIGLQLSGFDKGEFEGSSFEKGRKK